MADYELDSLKVLLTILESERDNMQKEVTKLQTQIENLTKEISDLEIQKKLNTYGQAYFTITSMSSRLVSEPKPRADEILRIAKKQKVKVYDFIDGYYLASWNDNKGYIHEAFIEETTEILAMKDFRKNQVISEEQDVKIRAREKRLKALTEKYDESVAIRIMLGFYWNGMTTEMARESLGSPDEINKSSGTWGLHEQWVYSEGRSKTIYLYFENGVLTSWQD